RTTDIGLRREPHPPIPTVMPERSSATASSSVQRLSFTSRRRVGAALGDEGVAVLVGDAGQVELEREALLVAVRPLDVPQVDAVQALLRSADHGGGLGGDL